MTKRFLIQLTVFSITCFAAFQPHLNAQSSKQLSLEEAKKAALTNNKSLQLASLDEAVAAANYKQTAAIYLPQINFSYTGISTNNPLNAFGFKLQQRQIGLTDFNPDLLNHPAATSDFTTKLSIQQPLINMDAVYMRKAAAMQKEIYQFKSKRTIEYTSFEVEKTYLQLQLAYKALKVSEEALTTAQSVLTNTNNHFNQGLVQKSDVLNVQVQIAAIENNITQAKGNIGNLSDYLSALMGQPLGTHYSVVENSSTQLSLIDTVIKKRADFIAMQKAIEANNLLIKSSKMSYLPKLNAFGSYQLNDASMLGFGANGYMAGLQVSWDIFKGFSTKHTIASQTLERDKLALQLSQLQEQSNVDVNKTKRAINEASVTIAKHQLAITQATEALRILENRYQQGLVSTTDIMLATTQRSQQQFELDQSVFQQQLSIAYLHFLTSSVNK